MASCLRWRMKVRVRGAPPVLVLARGDNGLSLWLCGAVGTVARD